MSNAPEKTTLVPAQTPDIDGAVRFTPHPLRAAILGEVHARPFTAISVPSRILHFAFDTGGGRAQADRANLVSFCNGRSLAAPLPAEKHHRVAFGATVLRWEQHSEFTTYTWEMPAQEDQTPFHPDAASLVSLMQLVPQPGPLLAAIDLCLMRDDPQRAVLERLFDRASLAAGENSDGLALYATDFRPDPAGFIRILIVDRGLGPERAGALVQRVIEIETYRTLALLGLPEAQRVAPSIGKIEHRLAEVTEAMKGAGDLAGNRALLDELTALAAEVEAGAAATGYRFSATRAYNDIVQQRLQTIGETKVKGLPTWSSFLARRMKPATQTCAAIEARQANLSLKLARAANLLRTRVDVALEDQNQRLLQSMNRRTQLQLRLQTTVEGLSVAAITYYVVGLFSYVAKAAHDSGLVRIEPGYATAIFVPVAALAIWLILRRIRNRHIGGEERD